MNDDTRLVIRTIIAELSASGAAFEDGEDLFARGVLRSLNLIELVNRLEDHFRVRLGHRDFAAGRLNTVDGIRALVGSRP